MNVLAKMDMRTAQWLHRRGHALLVLPGNTGDLQIIGCLQTDAQTVLQASTQRLLRPRPAAVVCGRVQQDNIQL